MMTDLQGKLLIAPPRLPDWRFQKSVVYLWKQDVTGASGIIINKKCSHPTFEMVCKDGNIQRKPEINPNIYYGGPVLTNLLGCLHTIDYRIGSTNVAKNSLGYTMDKKILEDIARSSGPESYIITMGMASWMAGQLEAEIDAQPPRSPALSWLILDYKREYIFGATKPNSLWELCVQKAIEEKSKAVVDKVFKT